MGTVTTESGSTESNFGNPIDVVTGEKSQTEIDWAHSAVHPLHFVRYYRSYATSAAGLGAKWSHNWIGTLTKTATNAQVQRGAGVTVTFVRDTATQTWKPRSGSDTLVDVAGGTEYRRASDDSRWVFGADGRLQSVTELNGRRYTLTYNAAGQLAAVANAFGRTLQFAYDAAGNLLSLTAPGGQTANFGYDAMGRLAWVNYPGGKSRSYHYEDARWPLALTGVSLTGARLSTFTYDAVGRGTSTQYGAGAQTYTVTYPQATRTEPTITPGTTVDPSVYQMVTYVTDPQGTQRAFTWQGGDGSVRMAGTDRPLADSAFASRTFGAGLLVESETDFMGVQTQYTWDVNRKLKLTTTRAANRPEAQTTSIQWHPSMRLPQLVTSHGTTTTYSYDHFGNTLSKTVRDLATGQERTWAWTYNDKSLPLTMTEPRGGVWRYAYDDFGNLSSVTDPLNRATVYTHDDMGRTLTQVEPGGLRTSYSYDETGRLLGVTQGTESTAFTYTAAGQAETVSMSNGYQLQYSYDAAQRLIGVRDNRGASITYTLDAAGNSTREEVKDASGAIALVTSRIVNELNRVTAVQGSVGQTTQIGYDANGVPISTTDPLNQTTRQTVDGLRRTTAATFADNTSATQSWNQLDQLTQVKDPKDVATQYTYNAFGEVLSETSPDIGTIRYTRDGAGQVTQIQDAKGQITHMERDALGRLTRIQYAANHEANFTYDQAGYVGKVEDKSGSTTYERDAQGRITSKTQKVNDDPSNPSSFTLRYSYTNGELTGMTYPSGLNVTYKRAAGRITGIDVQAPGKEPVPFVSALTHTALGQPKSWSWYNGDSAARTFDTDGRMTGSEIASYVYDAAGRITGITQQLIATRSGGQTYRVPVTWSAGYDNRNRLVSFVREGAETRYSYDANSNRLTAIEKINGDSDLDGILSGENRSQSNSQVLNVEGTSNRLLGFTQTVTTLQNGKTASVVTTPVTYSIDANGAMTSDGLRIFDYDESGRLAKVRVTKNGEAASITYLHNAMGQRVFKGEPEAEQTLPSEEELGKDFVSWLRKQFGWLFTQGNGAKTSLGQAFVYGDAALPGWALMAEYDNGGASGKGRGEYLWLPTEVGGAIPVGVFRGGKLYSVHADHLGTPRLIADDGGKPVWQWPYSAFGNNEPIGWLTGSSAEQAPKLKAVKPQMEVNLRFPGQYYDVETGLNQNWNREYNARQGRYTQFDPLGMRGGPNGYLYAHANPLTNIDPTGLVTWSGTLNVFAAQAAGGGGGATINYTLKSECVRGQRFIVQGEGIGGYMSLGWKVGASTSQVSLDDGLDYINPFVFNGPFDLVTAGGSFGVGWGWSSMNLGGAHAAGSTSWYNGRDFGLVSMHGRSKVSSVKLEECTCEK